MTPTCIPTKTLAARGLEPAAGSLNKGHCPEGLDTEDGVALVDYLGNTFTFNDNAELAQFDTFLNTPSDEGEAPAYTAINGTHFHSAGTGLVVGISDSCTQKHSTERTQYVCTATSSLQRHIAIEERELNIPGGRPFAPTWLLTQDVKTPDSQLIRSSTRRMLGTPAAQTVYELTDRWFVDGIPFLEMRGDRTLSLTMSRTPEPVVSPLYVNPYAKRTMQVLRTSPDGSLLGHPTSALTYVNAGDQQEFRDVVDTFVAQHRVQIDMESSTITFPSRTLSFITVPGSNTLQPAERLKSFYDAVFLAPLMPHILDASTRIFAGSPAELVALAKQHNLEKGCQAAIRRVFNDDDDRPSAGGLYCGSDAAIIYLGHGDEYVVNPEHGTMAHELGHRLHDRYPVLKSAFKPLYLDYTFTSLKAAGLPAEDFDFLMGIASNDRSNVAFTLSAKNSARVRDIFKQYSLERYFPTDYSLSNNHEFFAEIVETYRPWHSQEHRPRDYYGFYHGLDALAESGNPDDYLAAVRTQYPDMQKNTWTPPSKDNESTTWAVIAAMLGVAAAMHFSSRKKGPWDDQNRGNGQRPTPPTHEDRQGTTDHDDHLQRTGNAGLNVYGRSPAFPTLPQAHPAYFSMRFSTSTPVAPARFSRTSVAPKERQLLPIPAPATTLTSVEAYSVDALIHTANVVRGIATMAGVGLSLARIPGLSSTAQPLTNNARARTLFSLGRLGQSLELLFSAL